MPLTDQQAATVKHIIQTYRRDVRGLVKKHKERVVKTIESMDRKKADKIKQQIAAI